MNKAYRQYLDKMLAHYTSEKRLDTEIVDEIDAFLKWVDIYEVTYARFWHGTDEQGHFRFARFISEPDIREYAQARGSYITESIDVFSLWQELHKAMIKAPSVFEPSDVINYAAKYLGTDEKTLVRSIMVAWQRWRKDAIVGEWLQLSLSYPSTCLNLAIKEVSGMKFSCVDDLVDAFVDHVTEQER